jgi:cytosine/adenosine deaminase-related metal-dependent hydrolase
MRSGTDKILLRAQWVVPIDAPPISDGAVVFAEGRIVAVGPARELVKSYPDAQLHDYQKALLLPGLVNPHTHLEQSTCTAGDSPGVTFGEWVLSLKGRAGRGPNESVEDLNARATRRGIEQCIRFGITTIGDISQQMHLTRPILRDSPLRCVSYGEVLGLGARQWKFDELLPRAIDQTLESDRLRIGLTPHAPYTVDVPGYRRCLEIARQSNLPLATHLAEIPAEQEFMTSHSGDIRRIYDILGEWSDGVATFKGSPIEFARSIGLLDYPTLLAHVNYCDDIEMEMLADGRASVVYCPRTHAYFGHPPHRWREMLARGINVAVGTDSCASSPDLNILDDVRLLRKLAPHVPAQELFEMITIRAARALGMDHEVGSLTVGKRADLVAFDVGGYEPVEAILGGDALPSAVWIDGNRLT